MKEVRRLTMADFNAVEKLKIAAPKHLGVNVNLLNSSLRFGSSEFNRYLETGSVFYGFGAFVDQRLVSFAVGKMEHKDRYWLLNIIVSSQAVKFPPVNYVDQCIACLVKEAESKGIFTYYYVVPKKYSKVHNELWSSTNEVLARYDRSDFLEIPKYTRCTNSKFLPTLLSNKIFPIDLVIKKVTLRDADLH